jgi:hypothetical protein
LAGKLGPLFNAFQPTLLYILMIFNGSPYVPLASLINIPYILYVLYEYIKFIQQDKLCSFQEKGRLTWSWYKYGFGSTFKILYFIMIAFNFIFYISSPINQWVLALVTLFYFISYLNYRYHLGEFWCYLVTMIPAIILGVETFLTR